MRPVSDSFLNAVRGAHKAAFRARILPPGLVGVNPGPLNTDSTPTFEIPVINGDVTFDTSADVNATMDLTTLFDWPDASSDLGTPYGQEIYIERGIQYGNGTTEYVGLGYFRIDTIEQDNAPNGTLRISGSDRMANIRDGRRPFPIQFNSGTSVGAVIDFVVQEVLPSAVTVYDFPAYTTFLQTDYILDQDRLAFLQDLVTAYGKISYWDYAGRLQIKSSPDTTTKAVYTIDHGRNGVLVSMDRTLSRDGVYNAVVASGEPAGELPPVIGIAYDSVASSPTYWFGPFGQVPEFYSSSFLTTTDQCNTAAASILRAATGLPYSVSLGTVPNPALEGWDVINVTYSYKDQTETHIVDKITYSLAVDAAMGIDTRRQFLS